MRIGRFVIRRWPLSPWLFFDVYDDGYDRVIMLGQFVIIARKKERR